MAEKQNQAESAVESSEAVRRGTEASTDTSRRALEGTTQQMGQTAQQLLQAAEVYSDTARRLADEIRALLSLPTSAAGGVQDLTQAWTDWLSRAVEASTRFSQELMRAQSLPQVAETQSRYIEESLTGLREGGARVLEAASGIAEQALAPLEQGSEDEEQAATVGDVMTRSVKVASPDDSVQEVAQVMAKADARALPVAEEDRLVGMLTDRDIAVRLAAAGKDAAKTKVREVMTPEVKYVFDDESFDHVVENMAEQRLRRLPVMNREKRLVGILSLGDIATEQPEAQLVARALSGIAQSGGPHRQHAVAAHAGGKPKRQQQRQKRRR